MPHQSWMLPGRDLSLMSLAVKHLDPHFSGASTAAQKQGQRLFRTGCWLPVVLCASSASMVAKPTWQACHHSCYSLACSNQPHPKLTCARSIPHIIDAHGPVLHNVGGGGSAMLLLHIAKGRRQAGERRCSGLWYPARQGLNNSKHGQPTPYAAQFDLTTRTKPHLCPNHLHTAQQA